MKNKNLHLLFVVLLVFTFLSCDCWILVNGIVIDSQTKKPIENVRIEFLNIESTNHLETTDSVYVKNIFFTDSTGSFEMQSDNFGRCPKKDVKIRISKENYKQTDVILRKGKVRTDLIIELEKE